MPAKPSVAQRLADKAEEASRLEADLTTARNDCTRWRIEAQSLAVRHAEAEFQRWQALARTAAAELAYKTLWRGAVLGLLASVAVALLVLIAAVSCAGD